MAPAPASHMPAHMPAQGSGSCFREEAHTPFLSQEASRGQAFHRLPVFLAPASEVIAPCVSCMFVGDFAISPLALLSSPILDR